jgi:hypothetical protein
LLSFSATLLLENHRAAGISGWHWEGGAIMLYEIRVKGHLDQRWSDWFDGMMVTNEVNGDTVISGSVVDQAALHSLLIKIYNLNLTLISVLQIETNSCPELEK